MKSNPYAIVGRNPVTPPQYERVTASLSDRDIELELDGKYARENPAYLKALKKEQSARRRGRR